LAVGLGVLGLPGLATAAQAPAASLSTEQWAYGAEAWSNASVNLPNATLSVHGFLGWHVVLTATNVSSTMRAWEAQRTMAGSFFADYCQPNCTAPAAHGNLSVLGWEQDTGFANITSNAVVYEHGTPVAAFGIANASFRNAGDLTEALSDVLASG